MPIQQFSTYDLIVDTVPGASFLVLLAGALATNQIPEIFQNVFAAGAFLLIGGFVVGRVTHGISGYAFPEITLPEASVAIYLMYLLISYYFLFISIPLRFFFSQPLQPKQLWGFNLQPFYEDDVNQVDSWFDAPQDVNLEGVEERVVASVRRGVASQMVGYGSNRLSSNSVRHYGESMLYGKETLYRKYQMLITFFRNSMLISISFSIVYYIYWLSATSKTEWDSSLPFDVFDLVAPRSPDLYLTGSVLLFVAFAVMAVERRKFLSRTNRAFIYDLNEELETREE